MIFTFDVFEDKLYNVIVGFNPLIQVNDFYYGKSDYWDIGEDGF